MMKNIHIKYLSEEALETLKLNSQNIYELITLNPTNNDWIYSFFSQNLFVKKNFEIKDFKLKYPKSGNYNDVAYYNAILLYENLIHLPRRVLSNERFWLWLYLEKFYDIAVKSIELNSKKTLENHWTFKLGKRRGLFFGTLSRSFFRVERSVDENLSDKYELTKYLFERPERFRTLSWRTFSNNKTIVLGALKAQKDFEENIDIISTTVFNLISKRISRYSSVNFLDSLTEQEVYDIVYKELEKQIIERD